MAAGVDKFFGVLRFVQHRSERGAESPPLTAGRPTGEFQREQIADLVVQREQRVRSAPRVAGEPDELVNLKQRGQTTAAPPRLNQARPGSRHGWDLAASGQRSKLANAPRRRRGQGGITVGLVLMGGEFLVFVVGLALAVQALVGGGIYPEERPLVRSDLDARRTKQTTERDRVSLAIMGIGLMGLAIVVGSIVDV